jgi:hypothetical protein
MSGPSEYLEAGLGRQIRKRMRNLIGVADGVKLSESAPFGLALGRSDNFATLPTFFFFGVWRSP